MQQTSFTHSPYWSPAARARAAKALAELANRRKLTMSELARRLILRGLPKK